MDLVRMPTQAPNPTFEAKFHRSCGHVTWHVRPEPLADISSHVPPRYFPIGLPLCRACRTAQESPDTSSARLVASVVLRRITAIGFGRSRKDELKELRFSWSKSEELWHFKPTDGSLAMHLEALGGRLSCTTDVADTRVMPALPGAIDEVPPLRVPEWAFISCSPTGESMTLTPVGEMVWAHIGTTPWPPDPSAIPTASSAGLPPGVPRILGLPSVSVLREQGFTRHDLLSLTSRAADLEVVVYLADDLFDGRGLIHLPSAKTQQGPATNSYKSAKPKGGRPAKARAQSAEILCLAAQDLSAAAIAKHLGISSRSVRRVLDGAGHG